MSLNDAMNNPFTNFNKKIERINHIHHRDGITYCSFKPDSLIDRIRSEEKDPSISEKITEATNERAKELCFME